MAFSIPTFTLGALSAEYSETRRKIAFFEKVDILAANLYAECKKVAGNDTVYGRLTQEATKAFARKEFGKLYDANFKGRTDPIDVNLNFPEDLPIRFINYLRGLSNDDYKELIGVETEQGYEREKRPIVF